MNITLLKFNTLYSSAASYSAPGHMQRVPGIMYRVPVNVLRVTHLSETFRLLSGCRVLSPSPNIVLCLVFAVC